jgi:hypothetical protein
MAVEVGIIAAAVKAAADEAATSVDIKKIKLPQQNLRELFLSIYPEILETNPMSS